MKKIDKTLPFSVTTKVMYFFLVYFDKFSVLRLLLHFAIKFVIFFVYPIASLIHMIMIKHEQLNISVTENISIIISMTTMAIMSSILPFYSKEWKFVLEEIVDFESFEKSPKIKKTIIVLNNFSIILVGYCIGGSLLYTLSAIYGARECFKFNEENNVDLICVVISPVWLPFKINFSTEIAIFLIQLITLLMTTICSEMANFLICEFSMCASLRIHYLKRTFLDIIDNTLPEEQDNRLRKWIEDHQYFIKILEEANRLAKICLGFGSLSFGLVCAAVCNQVINKSKSVGAVLHLLGWVAALFMQCHAGQTITSETESMAEAVYNSKWYESNITTRKTILIILMRCQKPLTLDALPLGSLNYPLFMMIIKSSYSLLTFLSNTN